ncbi:iron ABC transporter permease [Nakamurella sp. PAMC28650]|uniref:ABC transporter permease n=1 Tax=Nakamurella sp. PAMC28650 TaxID=2762325 RepID=UPI001C9A85C0|nr:iron ABC transporter permease [Nakamurella sp. PAMC28650]
MTTLSTRPELVPQTAAARRLRWVALTVLALVPLAVFALFFLYPVGALMGRGLVNGGRLDLSGFGEGLGRARFRRIIVFTVGQAAASSGLCLLLGLPGAHVLYRCRFPGVRLVRALVTMPFVLPTVVVGLAFRTLFAANGPLGSWGWDGSLATILAAHVFLNYAVVVRTVGTSWANLDPRPAEAARTLGAGPVRAFCTIVLPALMPSLAAAFAIVFLFCATSFGVVLILGGSRYSTVETEIYHQTADLLDLRSAAVLSIVQIVLVATVLAVAGLLRRRTEVTVELRRSAGTARRPRWTDLPALIVTGGAAVLIAVPIAVLVIRSLQTPDGWGLANYRGLADVASGNVLLVPATTALGNSLRIALTATVLAVLLGVMLSVVLARRPRRTLSRRLIGAADAVVMLPLGVSAVTVGFGFLIALNSGPLDLRGSALLVPIAQALVATPLVIRLVLPVLRAADERLRQAAAMLGASPLRVWVSVDLPIMSRALAGASAFAFAVALGEFGATSFLARPETPTLPVLIGRLISRPGPANAGMALAAATLLAVVCAAVVLVVDAFSSDSAARWGAF